MPEGEISPLRRAIHVILGALALGLGGLVLAYPDFGLDLLIVLVGFAAIVLGVQRLEKGLFEGTRSSAVRAFDATIGLLAIGLGIMVLAAPGVGRTLLLILLALVLLFFGINRITAGGFNPDLPRWVRFVNVVIGGISGAAAILVLGWQGLGEFVYLAILAVGLVVIGAGAILSGIRGRRVQLVSM